MRLLKRNRKAEHHLEFRCSQQGGSLRWYYTRVITDTESLRFDIVEARYMSDMNDMSDICHIGWSGACGIGDKNHMYVLCGRHLSSVRSRSPRAHLRHRCIVDN